MTVARTWSGPPGMGACGNCRRRSWLLGDLSALLDYHRGDPARLCALLELDDASLIDALAGSRRETLREAWTAFPRRGSGEGAPSGCPHDPHWSGLLGEVMIVPMLWLTCPPQRLERLLDAPRIAILGPREASPYGTAVAGSFARGLAAAGVTVIGPLAGGLAAAVHGAAHAAGAGSIALAGDGLERIGPASAARVSRLAGRLGCVASGLPPGAGGRGWSRLAAQRASVALADAAIVVEADRGALSADGVACARTLGRPLGAVPGQVSSPLSAGPHALIREGAELIASPRDALEMLYRTGRGEPPPPRPAAPRRLRRELRLVLERVGAGEDRAEQLLRGVSDAGSVLAALGELEALGLLGRLPGGRYFVSGQGPP